MNWTDAATWDFAVLGFGGLFCLIWALGLGLSRGGSIHFAGIALVFVSGLRLSWEAFLHSGGAQTNGATSLLYGALLPCMYAIGPIIFLYYRALAKTPEHDKSAAHFLVLLPAALPFALWVLMDSPERARLLGDLRAVTGGERSPADWSLTVWVVGPKLSILFYSLMIPFHRAGEAMAAVASLPSATKWFARGLLGYIWSMILLDILGYLLGIPALFRYSAWSQTLAAVAVYLYSRREPATLLEFEKALRQTRYARGKLGGVDVEAALARLEHLMRSESYYADEDLRLSGLARACGLSPHQVSQLLNERLGLNFAGFVNKYRVAAAEKLLREEPERGILSIAMAAGFNSKSAFNRAFQIVHGKTPTAFRRENARPEL